MNRSLITEKILPAQEVLHSYLRYLFQESYLNPDNENNKLPENLMKLYTEHKKSSLSSKKFQSLHQKLRLQVWLYRIKNSKTLMQIQR